MTRVQFSVFGLAPSESACLQVKGDFVRVEGKKSGGKIVRKLQLPAGNQRRVGAREDVRRRGAYVAPGPQLTHQHHLLAPHHLGPASRDAGPRCVRAPAEGYAAHAAPVRVGTTHARGGESRSETGADPQPWARERSRASRNTRLDAS